MDVENAAAPASDEPGSQKSHEAGETDDFNTVFAKFFIEGALESFAVLAEGSVIDHRGGDCGFVRTRKPAGIRPIRHDEHDFRRIITSLGGLDQRARVRAAPGDQHGDALLAHYAGQVRSRRPLKLTALPPSAATTSPRRTTLSPCLANESIAAPALLLSSTATMPIPQLKVRSISCSAISPVAASHLNTGKTGTRSSATRTPSPGGSTRGIFSTKPPPVICASALTALLSRMAARHERT